MEMTSWQDLRHCNTTKREDLFAAVDRVLDMNRMSWEKMVGIMTAWAPAMVWRKVGLATLVSQKVAQHRDYVAQYHRIVHQEQLGAKSIGLGDMVHDVIAVINCTHSKAFSHCQFGALLKKVDSEYKYRYVFYHQEMRRLSRGKVLKRFFWAVPCHRRVSVKSPLWWKIVLWLDFYGVHHWPAQHPEYSASRKGTHHHGPVWPHKSIQVGATLLTSVSR